MTKIIDFNKLKKEDEINDLTAEELKEIFSFLDESEFFEASSLINSFISKYGYTKRLCEIYSTTITLYSDDLDINYLKTCIDILYKAYHLHPDSLHIGLCVSNFYANVYDALDENDTIKVNELMTTIYNRHKTSEDISFFYCINLMNAVTDSVFKNVYRDAEFFLQKDKEFKAIYNDFTNSEDIAITYANFIYFSADIVNTDEFMQTSFKSLRTLNENFKDSYEIAAMYASFLGDRCIGKKTDECVIYLAELKKLSESLSDYISILRTYAIALSHICVTQSYQESISIMKEFKRILVYSHYDDSISGLFAETLSDFSCEENLSAEVITKNILTEFPILLKYTDDKESIAKEYALALYNLSCISNYDKTQNSPHLEIINKLRDLTTDYENVIAFYCLAISNLIHLEPIKDGYLIVNEIRDFFGTCKNPDNIRTKNMLSLRTILAISLANLVNEVEINDCLPLIKEIKNLVNSLYDTNYKEIAVDSNSDILDYNDLLITRPAEITLDFENIFKQYIRALTYYSKKQDENASINTSNLINELKRLVE